MKKRKWFFTVRRRSLLKVGFVSCVCDFLVCFEALFGFKGLESSVLQRKQIILKGSVSFTSKDSWGFV